MTSFDIPVQEIIADIRGGSLHPLDGDWPIANVEIVLQEFVGMCGGLPVKLFRDFRPKLFGVRNRLVVFLLVLVPARDVGIGHHPGAGWKRFIVLCWHFALSLFHYRVRYTITAP